jgi:hypothetical protein
MHRVYLCTVFFVFFGYELNEIRFYNSEENATCMLGNHI